MKAELHVLILWMFWEKSYIWWMVLSSYKLFMQNKEKFLSAHNSVVYERLGIRKYYLKTNSCFKVSCLLKVKVLSGHTLH